jgi:5-methylcytosine-specific restriction endonuclease McrA
LRRLRKEIMKERGAFCQECKIPDVPFVQQLRLHIHHILRQSRFPRWRFDKNNVLLLCQECHEKYEQITPLIEEVFRTDEFTFFDLQPPGGWALAGPPILKGVRFC